MWLIDWAPKCRSITSTLRETFDHSGCDKHGRSKMLLSLVYICGKRWDWEFELRDNYRTKTFQRRAPAFIWAGFVYSINQVGNERRKTQSQSSFAFTLEFNQNLARFSQLTWGSILDLGNFAHVRHFLSSKCALRPIVRRDRDPRRLLNFGVSPPKFFCCGYSGRTFRKLNVC